jgi:drug/metabolite transporter (DMT)-like permease
MSEALLLLAVAALSAGQVLQKVAAARHLSGAGTAPREWLRVLLSRELVAAIACLAAGTALWLAVLYRMDVSRAFPFLSLGSIVVVAASRWLLRERVSVYRWAGVALITLGIALVAST